MPIYDNNGLNSEIESFNNVKEISRLRFNIVKEIGTDCN